MNSPKLAERYPLWRTEAFSPDSRPLVDGHRGRMHVGLSSSRDARHAEMEVEIVGISPEKIAEAGAFFSDKWHGWEDAPPWIRGAVGFAAAIGTRSVIESSRLSERAFKGALDNAISLLDSCPGDSLSPVGALKQAGADRGIQWGAEMEAFINWASPRLAR